MNAVRQNHLVGFSLRNPGVVVLPPVPDNGDERGVLFAYCMMLLTFPLGAAFYTIVNGITHAVAIQNPVLWSPLLLAMLWIPLASLGYFQWFIALPFVLRKVFDRRDRFKPSR